MNKIGKSLIIIVCLCMALIACSRITRSNFQKIQPNMSMTEVVAILGEPTSSESVNVAGVSGTSATWRSEDTEIAIQFLNDRVAVKSLSKISGNQPTMSTNSKVN